jgi:SAM-dependent methyltransferase
MPVSICKVCGTDALEVLDGYETLPRVTSDCRPWPAGGKIAVCSACGGIQKLADDEWLAEISKIYDDYHIYHQSAGGEQQVFFADGSSVSRSSALVDFIVERCCRHIGNGRLIDIGCGNGMALSRFSKALPGWLLDGSELSDKTLDSLRTIPGFRRLFTCPIPEIPTRYNIVSIIHTLEHFADPYGALTDTAQLLEDDGYLLIEVPNIEVSPFDLVVADHLLHFSRNSLSFLVSRAGFKVEDNSDQVLRKELTLLARLGSPAHLRPSPAHEKDTVQRILRWLASNLEKAQAASNVEDFGLFGSSIASQWLYGILGPRVKFFVDEDPSRIGRAIQGIPIISPAEVREGATIYVPLETISVSHLAPRLAGFRGNYVYPPSAEF